MTTGLSTTAAVLTWVPFKDGPAQVRRVLRAGGIDAAQRLETHARATPLDTVVRASAGSDPDTARVRALHERWRAEGFRTMLELLRPKSALRTGVGPEHATHLLLLYLGMDVNRVLVHDFGWTHDDWVDWTVATVAEQVFALQREGQRERAGRPNRRAVTAPEA